MTYPRMFTAGSLVRAASALALGACLWIGAGHWVSAFADDTEELKNPVENNPEAIAKGEELFSERCSFCHGGHGRGAKGPPLTAGHYKRGGADATLFGTIMAGRPGTQMGAFGLTLSQDDVWDIIAYLRDETKKRQAAGELSQ